MLEENSAWMDKKQAEDDPQFKQLIGYCAVVSPDNRIFTYRRAVQDARYEEKRLQGKWSIGIGGHIEPHDSSKNGFIQTSIRREIGEEIEMNGNPIRFDLIGLINDDLNSVGKVHLGLLMIARSDSNIIIPKDPEIAFGELKSLEEIEALFQAERDNVDYWSLIGFPQIPL